MGTYTAPPYGTWMQTTDRGSLGTSYPLTLQPNGGNVGIGTTNPTSNLSILSSSMVGDQFLITSNAGGSATSGITLRTPYTGSNYDASMMSSYYGSAVGNHTVFGMTFALARDIATTGYRFDSNSGTTRLFIDSATGNVGIGTTAPLSNLDLGAANSVNSSFKAGAVEIQPYALNNNWIADNIYYNGSNYVFRAAGSGESVQFYNGGIVFSTFGSGAAGAAATQAGRMMVTSSGNVGIGITSPSYTLHVVGTAGLSTGTSWTNASDIRLKDIEGDYEYGLDEVRKLHTVRFKYKKDNALNLPTADEHTGFIAQEVQQLIPDAVHVREDGYLELNVDPIHWATVNAVQELALENDQLTASLAQVQTDTAQSKARADKAEAEAAQLKASLAQVQTDTAQSKARADKAEAEAAQLKASLAQVQTDTAKSEARADRAESESVQLKADAAKLKARADKAESESLQLKAVICTHFAEAEVCR